MSRIGKQDISIPEKTTVSVADGVVTVEGPKGTLSKEIHPSVQITVADGHIKVEPLKETIEANALWGTFASHVLNMIKGVNEGFEKKLIIEGVGYRAEMKGTDLQLNVGFSHPVLMVVPEGLSVAVEKNEITITGADKEAVGQFTAKIRATKVPEPYKGKGIRYSDEVVRRKQGKKGVA